MSVAWTDTPSTNAGGRRTSIDFVVTDAPMAQVQISTKFPSGLEEVVWRAGRFAYYYDQSTVSEDGETEGTPTTYSIVRKGGWPTTSVTLQIDENNVAHATTHELGGGDAIDAAQLSWSEGQSAAGNLGEKLAAVETTVSDAQSDATTAIADAATAQAAATAAQATADNHDSRHAHGAADALQSATLSYTGGLAAAGNLGTQIDAMVAATTTAQAAATDGVVSANTASGTTYTAVIGDANKVVPCTHASGCAFTIPPNSSVAWPAGCFIAVCQRGAAQVTLTAGAGVTFRTATTAKTEKLNATLGAYRLASDEWVIIGNWAAT